MNLISAKSPTNVKEAAAVRFAAGVLRLDHPNWLLQIVVVLLLAANVLNIGADPGAMADAARLLLPAPAWLWRRGEIDYKSL